MWRGAIRKMKKIISVTVILIVLIVGSVYIAFFDNPFSEKRRISQVEEYIANQPLTSEISNIYAEWDAKRGDYDIFVVFDNEPNLTYNYIIHSEEKEGVLLIIREKVNGRTQEIKEGENGVAEGDPVNEDY
ncbi:DUF3139 domain-containing protein [Shouchella clausii]|nr:DUF3139 domain-containing protein [Shouchella clausii]